jgi:hypothetical protein
MYRLFYNKNKYLFPTIFFKLGQTHVWPSGAHSAIYTALGYACVASGAMLIKRPNARLAAWRAQRIYAAQTHV